MAGGDRYLYVIDYVNHLGDSLSGLRSEIEATPSVKNIRPTNNTYELDEIDHYVTEIHKAADAFDPFFQDNEEQDLLADIKLFTNHLTKGKSPDQLTHPVRNKIKYLPNLETFYKLFNWLDKVTKAVDKEKNPAFLDKVKETISVFERQLRPLIDALQTVFVVSIRNDLLHANKDDLKRYSWLKTALDSDSKTLSRIGIEETTQVELAEIINPVVIQGHFEYSDVKQAFDQLSEKLNSGSLAEVQKFLEENQELYHKNPDFESAMAQAISFQLDPKKPLTVPQKIIRMTKEPEEEKIALEILKSLKDYGVNFTGKDKEENTCLHLLRSWHEGIAKFLLATEPNLKFPLNSQNQSPRDLFIQQFEASNDPYYDEAKFVRISELLKTPFDKKVNTD